MTSSIHPTYPKSIYTYSHLPSRSHIRLLTLLPGKFDSIINCKLTSVSLSETIYVPRYEALSYTWGVDAAVEPASIILSDFVLPIRSNLASALRHLRDLVQERVIWADAICIDQSDVLERNSQVSHMGEIFYHAERVLVWLGREEDGSADAMKLIKDMSFDMHRTQFAIVDDPSKWKSLALLMVRPWFRRRWVIQEVAFAREAVVHCGAETCSWDQFSTAVLILQQDGSAIWQALKLRLGMRHHNVAHRKGDLGANAPARLLVASRDVIRVDSKSGMPERRHTLEELIWLFPDFEATDPRDMIYALIPLAKDVHQSSEWQPDYSKPLDGVWAQYICHVLRDTSRLDIICRPWLPPSFHAPSWIPNLSKRITIPGVMLQKPRNTSNVLVGQPGMPTSGIYSASGNTDAAWRTVGNVLYVNGYWIDTIKNAGSTAIEGDIPSDWEKMMLRTLRVHTLGAPFKNFGHYLSEDICHTIVAGRTEDGKPPPTSFLRAVNNFWGRDLTTHPKMSTTDEAELDVFLSRARKCTLDRKIATTTNRRVGLFRTKVRPGDKIVILFGCSVPVVLRKQSMRYQQYTLLGACYVHGVMEGQTLPELESGMYHAEEFPLK